MPRHTTLDRKYEATGASSNLSVCLRPEGRELTIRQGALGGFVYPGGGRAQNNKLTRQQVEGVSLTGRERSPSPKAKSK